MKYVAAALLVAACGGVAIQAPADSVTVYRCVKDGTTVFSDQPCAPNAKAEVIEHDAAPADPSLMVDPSSPSLTRSRPAFRTSVPQSKPNTQASGQKADPCESAQRQIDNINARMREGYTSQTGEYLRNQLRSAQKSYSECRKRNP